jgi:DNA-binding response OmpR family regulator
LDIEIKGKKDGLDIAAYIRENFYSPVIILSGKDTDSYLRRASFIGVDGYTIKAEKPYDLKQLRVNIRMLLPLGEQAAKRRQESAFLHVKEFTTAKTADDFFVKRRIEWAALKLATTEKAPRNCTLLQMANGTIYVYRSSLAEMYDLLPDFFIRVNNYEIVNTLFFDGEGKVDWVYFIGSKRYEIAPAYRTTQKQLLLKRRST